MAKESKRPSQLEEAPRSLEGTAADIANVRPEEAKRSPLLYVIILLALACAVATAYFLGGHRATNPIPLPHAFLHFLLFSFLSSLL